MEPPDKASKWAQAITEGLNCLGVFLCRPALQKLRAEAPSLLHRWEVEYAPIFREIDVVARGGDLRALRAALATISAMTSAGVDVDSSVQLAALREAIREAITRFGFRLPVVPLEEAAVCELHGSACPMLDKVAT